MKRKKIWFYRLTWPSSIIGFVSCAHTFVVILILVGCLVFLRSISNYHKLKGVKLMTSNRQQTQSQAASAFIDSLVTELKESIESIALYSDTEKVVQGSAPTCNFNDKELKQHKCFANKTRSCIQEQLSTDLRHRIEDLVYNENLQIASKYRTTLLELQRKVEDYHDLVIVSALSSNHYLESQAMLKWLHEELFSYHHNVKLVVYDIGLSAIQHESYKRLCRCQLIKFPFDKFPVHCRNLKCFCWKAIVTRAHLANGNNVMWIDASVRFTNPTNFSQALKRTKLYGVQQNRMTRHPKIPTRALPAMFHHFGFTPCLFMTYSIAASNWGIYRNSPLIQHAVLDSWVACGLNKTCTCPGSIRQYLFCPEFNDENRNNVGICQRPQAALALILSRLWMEDYHAVAAIQDSFELWKNHKVNYFKDLDN